MGCASLEEKMQRAFSKDGLTSSERFEKQRAEQAEREAAREKAEQIKQAEDAARQKAEDEKLAACIKFCNENKYTDMKRFETCSVPDRKGLAKNSIATFYFWYNGNEPFYAYFDKVGKLLVMEKDQETIDKRHAEYKRDEEARRAEYKRDLEVLENQKLKRLEIYSANKNANKLNDTIRIENCRRNSSPMAAVYCN